LGTFLMERYSPAQRSPSAYNVKRIVEEADRDLAIYFDYEVEDSLDADMAELVAERLVDTLPDKSYPQFYATDIYRFLYACHLKEQGAPMPPWLIPESAQT